MMFPKIQYFPLYWENGMKLAAEHFQHLENSVDDALRDVRATGLHAGQYGLLPYSELVLRNSEGAQTGTVRVTVESCRAILPGGRRVEILSENVHEKQIPIQAPFIEFAPVAGMRYWIYLCVDERGLAKAGVPQVRPIRYPYLAPKYYLECLSIQQLVNGISPQNRMKIAEWSQGKLIENYIPACLTLQGHRLLMEWHRYFQNTLENIVQLALRVMDDFRGKDPHRIAFSQAIIGYIRPSQGYYRLQLPMQAPIHLVAYFTNFAGLIQSLIETCDRDFVRNQLKEGKINELNGHLLNLSSLTALPHDGMSSMIGLVYGFLESVSLTLKALRSSEERKIIQDDLNQKGNRKIASG
jgi:hypothetical protein